MLDTVTGGLTTQDLVAAERRLIAAAIGRAGEGVAVVERGVLERALAAVDRPLSDEQAEALRGVSTSGNGVDVVEALAGTGKTFTAGALRQVYEDAGYHVIGIAPTGRAVRELAEEAGVAAWTLDRALLDLRDGHALPERTVVLLDEAGMASTRGTERLLAAAQLAGAKVIAIGDSGQLPSVQAGGWMREVGQRVGVHRLTQVMRQRDVDERRALAHLHDGRPGSYLEWAEKNERVVVHTDGGAIAAALEDWKRAVGEHGAAQAVLIARDNDTRAALNAAAREHVRAQGQLGDDVDYGPVTVAVGERIICRRNDRFADVDNGTRGTVLETRPQGLLIETDAGPLRTLPAAYVGRARRARLLPDRARHAGRDRRARHRGGHAARLDARLELHRALARPSGDAAAHRRPGRARRRAGRARRARAPRRPPAPAARRRARARGAAHDHPRRRGPRRDPAAHPAGARPARRRRAATPRDRRTRAHGREAEPPAAVPAQRAALRAVRAELVELAAQRAALPLRELRELDAVEQERAQVRGQRDDVAARLASLPAPQRSVLGRTKDPHAAERARLAAAVDGADRQLAALDSQRDRLTAATGGLPAARDERDALDRREGQLQREARELLDQLAERDVVAPPSWARETFGERPDNPRAGEQWDRGVRAVARYRVEHDVPDEIPGLGPEPPDRTRARRVATGRDRHRGGPEAARPQRRPRPRPRPRRRPRALSQPRTPRARS